MNKKNSYISSSALYNDLLCWYDYENIWLAFTFICIFILFVQETYNYLLFKPNLNFISTIVVSLDVFNKKKFKYFIIVCILLMQLQLIWDLSGVVITQTISVKDQNLTCFYLLWIRAQFIFFIFAWNVSNLN